MVSKTMRLITIVGAAWVSAIAFADDRDLDGVNAELKDFLVMLERCPGPLLDGVSCMNDLSLGGNRLASKTLAELYADPSSQGEPSGLKANSAESLRYTLLANNQGSYSSLKFLPPGPYNAAVGMSDVQVKASNRGEPDGISVEERGGSRVQKWQYRDATFEFELSPVSSKHWILKRIRQSGNAPGTAKEGLKTANQTAMERFLSGDQAAIAGTGLDDALALGVIFGVYLTIDGKTACVPKQRAGKGEVLRKLRPYLEDNKIEMQRDPAKVISAGFATFYPCSKSDEVERRKLNSQAVNLISPF